MDEPVHRGLIATLDGPAYLLPFDRSSDAISTSGSKGLVIVVRRTLRPCAVPGCPEIAMPGQSWCPRHSEEKKRAVDARRPSAAKRGYDRKWRMTRARFLRAHPLCACGAPATEAHHIIPRCDGGSDRWNNLRAMCKSCHSSLTAFGRG